MSGNCVRSHQVRLAVSIAFLLLAFWAAPGAAGGTGGAETPQAVFELAQAAGAKKDFSALTKLVAPSERPMLAFNTDMGVSFFVEFYEGEKAPELKKKYKEVQDKYGIGDKKKDGGEKLTVTNDTPKEVIEAHMRKRANRLFGDVDVVGLVPDLMALVLDLPEMAGQAFFPPEKLTDLKIEGERATGKAGKKKISFIREDNRWYLAADAVN